MSIDRGYPEHEIEAAVAEKIAECTTEAERDLVTRLAAEAKRRGHCWPLKPKYVAPPPLRRP